MIECSPSFFYGVVAAYIVIAAFLGGWLYRDAHVEKYPG